MAGLLKVIIRHKISFCVIFSFIVLFGVTQIFSVSSKIYRIESFVSLSNMEEYDVHVIFDDFTVQQLKQSFASRHILNQLKFHIYPDTILLATKSPLVLNNRKNRVYNVHTSRLMDNLSREFKLQSNINILNNEDLNRLEKVLRLISLNKTMEAQSLIYGQGQNYR